MPARETAGKARETISDQELVEQLAEKLAAAVGAELELHRKQLDHIDEMLHGVTAFIDQYRPLLERFTKWAGPGRGWRTWQNGTPPRKLRP